VAIGVIVSFTCAKTGAANEQAATRMAARNTLRRAEMRVECITMAVGFLLRNRRFVPEVRCQFSHTMTTAQSRGAPVPRIIALSRATYRKMMQNLWWAAGYNIVAIPLAAGVLAARGILLPPAFAAVLMSASTVIVAINAQLLRRAKL
jgi:hypothetical protein